MSIPTSERVYDGFVKVDKVTVSSVPHPLEVVRTSDSVAFLVFNIDTNEFLFAIQERAPMMCDSNPTGTILEVGAGRFDLKIGVRGLVVKELWEELGVTVAEDEVCLLNDGIPLAMSPGVLTEKQYLAFVAVRSERIDPTKQLYGNRGEGERVARRFIPVADITSGKVRIEDMKTWALVQWFLATANRSH